MYIDIPPNFKPESKTILAVDDDTFIRKIYVSVLNNKGFNVTTATYGTEAIEMARDLKPDLIFLDIMMPNVDGFQTLEILKKMENTKDIPVVMVTTKSDRVAVFRSAKLGAAGYIVKPFSRAMLLEKINEVLSPPADDSSRD